MSTKIVTIWWLLCVSQFLLALSGIHYYDFILKETNVTKLCVSRQILTVNDSFPGPVIRVHKGDTAYVNVINLGDYGVTLHWHGVKQPRNPWSDGPEFITQCALGPGESMKYEVIFSDEEGTLWWHAHSDWTRATVHGAIVIYPKDGTTFPFPKPDGEEIIVIGSWYKEDVKTAVDEALSTGSDPPHSSGYTINGELGDFSNCSNGTTYHRVVDYGKTYQFRVINAVLNAELFFAIADHNVTVVGMDGAYVKPFNTSYILISPGQTMDLLLTANQSPGRYYMMTRQYSSEDLAVTGFDHSNGSAILEYSGNYSSYSEYPVYPHTLPMYMDMKKAKEYTRRIRSLASPQYAIDVPQNVSTSMLIVVSMNELYRSGSNASDTSLDYNKLGSSLNNVSWVNPFSLDVLSAYYRDISGIYTTDFPDFPPSVYNFTGDIYSQNISLTVQATKVKVLNYNESVEIVFQGTNVLKGPVNHPMHLHGHSFYVVGFGDGNFNNETDPKTYNLVDPPKVNTFSVPKNGWLTIRFRTNNPGVWLWHCHLDRHMSWGMDTVFIVKNGGTSDTSIRPPPSLMPSCVNNSDISMKTSIGGSYMEALYD